MHCYYTGILLVWPSVVGWGSILQSSDKVSVILWACFSWVAFQSGSVPPFPIYMLNSGSLLNMFFKIIFSKVRQKSWRGLVWGRIPHTASTPHWNKLSVLPSGNSHPLAPWPRAWGDLQGFSLGGPGELSVGKACNNVTPLPDCRSNPPELSHYRANVFSASRTLSQLLVR